MYMGQGHRSVAVLLPSFAIIWLQNQVTKHQHTHDLTHIYIYTYIYDLPPIDLRGYYSFVKRANNNFIWIFEK